MKSKFCAVLLGVLLTFTACDSGRDKMEIINKAAQDYVNLVLHVGTHDPVFVDAYYGPEEWKPDSIEYSLEDIIHKEEEITRVLNSLDLTDTEIIWQQRKNFLLKQLGAVKAYAELLQGKKMNFDEQSKSLYDAVSPHYSATYVDSILKELDSVLPGKGDLYTRFNSLNEKFTIPDEKVSEVFDAAIAECRKRTKEFINLPENENFETEYVTDQVWGAYNWYKGNNYSLIQINTDLPKRMSSPVGLASHEGYPGHHVYNVLLETKLYQEKGWVEYCVYPLFSPQSLIAEGTANYGVEVIFPANERHEFEKTVLFPLAGLDTTDAEIYFKANEIAVKLGYASNEIARELMDGKISDEEAVNRMVKLLSKPERARKSLSFIKANGSYVITYNIGHDIVREYLKRTAGEDKNKIANAFFELLSRPATASDLL